MQNSLTSTAASATKFKTGCPASLRIGLGFWKSKQRSISFQKLVPSLVQILLTALNKLLCNPIASSITLEDFFALSGSNAKGFGKE